MLPVTHKKVLVIPHSLAAVAAAVCLVAALAWDRQDPLQEDLTDTQTAVEAAEAEEETTEPNHVARAREQKNGAGNRRQLELRLFPLLLNPRSGGG